VLGDITYTETGKEPVVVTIVEEYVHNRGDAWSFFLDEIGRFLERALASSENPDALMPENPYAAEPRKSGLVPPRLASLMTTQFLELVRLLGRRTAELHLALVSDAGDPEFSPEPFTYLYQQSLATSMISYAQRIREMAVRAQRIQNESTRKDLDLILSNFGRVLAPLEALKREAFEAVRARTHGDYHLGQVLYTGKDFFVIDFEGEPARAIGERRIKRSPLRDVAGMIRSFHYASHTGISRQTSLKSEDLPLVKRWADAWYRACVFEYLSGYLEQTIGTSILPKAEKSFTTLLKAFLTEKAIYELGYELNNRPDWVAIPLEGLKELLDISPR
jgi:maltose alpha-D-glucosyltransferase/alpha-amylase